MAIDNLSDFNAGAAEIAIMLRENDIEGAVRRSGELLAVCDNDLRSLYNDKKPVNDAVLQFVEAAVLHVHSLRLAHASADAFSCALGALLTIEVYRASEAVDSARKVRLYHDAVRSAIDSFDRQGDATDGGTEDHRGYILSYLASLLYHFYKKAVAEQSESNVLPEVYSFLKAISSSGAIQTPTIKLGEKDVDPDQPGPLLVDIMGRGAALGIYA